MDHKNLDIKEVMKERRHAIEQSLHMVSAAELKKLADDLFPDVTHPWLELFLSVINDPSSGTFYSAAGEHIEVLYCHDKDIGMWFIPDVGKGPLQPEHLKIMKEIVEGRY